MRCCGAGRLLQLMGNTCSNATRMDESVYPEEEVNNISVSRYSLLLAVLLSRCCCLQYSRAHPFVIHSHPMSKLVLQALLRAAVTKTTSSNTGVTPSAGVTVADPALQQLAQALVHDGTSTACQLHDSAASESCTYADHISCRAEFLTRRHTANINEAAHIFRAAAKPVADQAERAFVQMPPFEARKTFLLGAPKPACCPERSKTAEGINKLRQTVDPDIGRQPRIQLQLVFCNTDL